MASRISREKKRGPWVRYLMLLALLLIPSFLLSASSSNNFFKRAERYTVRVYSSTIIALEGAKRGSSEASGFVVHIDRKQGLAYVATNKHVIDEGISSIQVSFKDGERFPATPIYIDPVYDFGMIRFDLDEPGVPDNVQAAELGRSSTVEVGHPVGTFGNPMSLEYCATEGIISSVTNSPWGCDGAFLQTDAAINPGNSGGPLISLRNGKVIGINTAVSDESEGIGWSLAVDQLKPVIEQVIAGELPYAGRMGWLGVNLEEINLDRAREDFGAQYGFNHPRKALLVIDVFPKTPAARSGLQPGDVIYLINWMMPQDYADYLAMMRDVAGQNCEMVLYRLGQEIELEVEVEDRGELRPKEYVAFAGMTIQPASPTVYESYSSVSSPECVFVSDVKEGSSAEAWGMYSGDPIRGAIVNLNYHPIKSLDDFWNAVKDVAPGQPVEFFVGSPDNGWIVKVVYYYPSEAPWREEVECRDGKR